MSATRNVLIIAFATVAYLFVLAAASKLLESSMLRFEFPVLPVVLIEQAIVSGTFGFVVARLLKNPRILWNIAILILPITSSTLGWVNLNDPLHAAVRPPFWLFALVVSTQYLFCLLGVYLAVKLRQGTAINA